MLHLQGIGTRDISGGPEGGLKLPRILLRHVGRDLSGGSGTSPPAPLKGFAYHPVEARCTGLELADFRRSGRYDEHATACDDGIIQKGRTAMTVTAQLTP